MHVPRPGLGLILVLGVLLGGCVDAPTPDVVGTARDETRADDQYWMVHVAGEEDPVSAGAACDVRFDHFVDAEAQTVTYLDDVYEFDPGAVRVLVALDAWEHTSDCPLAYKLLIGDAHTGLRIGGSGIESIQVRDDGRVTVDGTHIQPGQTLLYNYTTDGREGRMEVRALGAWPQDGLIAQ